MTATITIMNDMAVSPNAAAQDAGAVCAYPFSCRTPGGRIVCAYRQGTTKHSLDGVLLAQYSDDGGLSWSAPAVVFDGLRGGRPESALAGVVCPGGDNEVIAFLTAIEAKKQDVYVFSEEGRQLRQRLYAVRSADNGATWGKPGELILRDVPPNIYTGASPVRLPGGAILLPLEATGVRAREEFTLAAFFEPVTGALSPVFDLAHDTTGELSYGDARFAVLDNGVLLMLVWTFRTRAEETVPVHRCVSRDNGRTWTPPEATNAPCQILSPLGWGGERVVAVGNVRTAPEGIRLFTSGDGGKTWDLDSPVQLWDPREQRVVNRALPIGALPPGDQQLWSELPAFTFGTPELIRLSAYEALMTYYAMLGPITHIRACRLRLREFHA